MDKWEESLSSIPQREYIPPKQNMSYNTSEDSAELVILSDIEEIVGKSTSLACSSDNPLMFSEDSSLSVKKKPRKLALGGTKKSNCKQIKQVNPDTSFPLAKSLVTKKQKSEKTGQKRLKTIRGSLLLGSHDAIVQKLKKGCLQWSEKIQKEKR